MPHISAAAAPQICVLLPALPAQYFISQWYGTDSAQRIQITEGLIIAPWSTFTKSYLSLDVWADRSFNSGYQRQGIGVFAILLDFACDTVIYKVFYSGFPYFINEPTHVRSPKPEYIQFSVGQVIVHKRFGYSGVTVGWDVKADTPEDWLQARSKRYSSLSILINKANGFGKSTAYIPEEEITIIMGLVVHHPDTKAYFSGYDGSQYIMLPWLKKIYPHD